MDVVEPFAASMGASAVTSKKISQSGDVTLDDAAAMARATDGNVSIVICRPRNSALSASLGNKQKVP